MTKTMDIRRVRVWIAMAAEEFVNVVGDLCNRKVSRRVSAEEDCTAFSSKLAAVETNAKVGRAERFMGPKSRFAICLEL